MNITSAFEWIETRLDKGSWFRRGYLVAATTLMWQTSLWAMRFADAHADRPGVEVAAIITAATAVPGLVMAHAFNIYITSRTGG